MSYLSALRLHFAGRFQANVSTVNNDPAHFDNATFVAAYQTLGGPKMDPANGWFNPQGDASFRLLGCAITSAWSPQGAVGTGDPVLGYSVADSDRAVPAKLVDLDPEQQLVSTIWGLEVRIADAAGNTMLRGQYVPAAFFDIWDRAPRGGDNGASATYQSVLTDLEWGDVASSSFLSALQAAAMRSGRLSIKFTVDGLDMDFTSPNFMCGRIAGTIGPAAVGEPMHMVLGRQFMAANDVAAKPDFFLPIGGINFCAAVVDPAGCLYLDLGNALSCAVAGGAMKNIGDLRLGVYFSSMTSSNPAGTILPLGTLSAATYAEDSDWYACTAGVVAFPLTPDQMQAIAASPLVVYGPDGSGVFISEWSNGAFLRADDYVYRMSPGDSVNIPVYATQWGAPWAGRSVAFVLDPSQLQAQVGADVQPYIAASPPVAVPDGVLAFATPVTTDANGVAMLRVTAHDPGTPRWFNNGADYGIDGQVYGLRPVFSDAAAQAGPINQWNFVSFLVWSAFTAPDPVTWTEIQPIFQQYANLYPVMLRFLNLADPAQVQANAHLLTFAFSLPIGDPNTMPVTRDLSPAKRAAILAWLADPLPGPQREVAPRPPSQASEGDSSNKAAPPSVAKGGKAAAAARRLVLQHRQGVE